MITDSILSHQILVLTCLVACAMAYPYPRPDDGYAPPVPVYGAPELPIGRVKMQVIQAKKTLFFSEKNANFWTVLVIVINKLLCCKGSQTLQLTCCVLKFDVHTR